jgi:hypothetical protein
MFSWIRRRFNYANVTATLALFFAMTGGALAASHYLITSPKQIKPSVLSALKGKAGPAGATGANGANGVAGPQGPQGPEGKAGSNGSNGVSPEGVAFSGAQHGCSAAGGVEFKGASTAYACNGKNGANGTTGFTETLPPEKTETGKWYVAAAGSVEAQQMGVAISFPIPLKAPLSGSGCAKKEEPCQVHYVSQTELGAGQTPSACPGTPEEPRAEPGNLCVYERTAENAGPDVDRKVFIGPGFGDFVLGRQGALQSGAVLIVFPGEESSNIHMAEGSWAVTAPKES